MPVTDEKLFLRLLLSGKTFSTTEIAETVHKTETETIKTLAELEKRGLVEMVTLPSKWTQKRFEAGWKITWQGVKFFREKTLLNYL